MSDADTQNGTHSQGLENALEQFQALQKEQNYLLRELLAQLSSIPKPPMDRSNWEDGFHTPHPYYSYRSQPRYRRIFSADEPPQPQERNIETQEDAIEHQVCIESDIPSSSRQKSLRKAFLEKLPVYSSRYIEGQPEEVVQYDKTTEKHTEYKAKGEWTEDRAKSTRRECWPTFNSSVPQGINIPDISVYCNVISVPGKHIRGSPNNIHCQINEDFNGNITGRYIQCFLRGIVTLEQISLFCSIFSNIMPNTAVIIALVELLQAYTSAWSRQRREDPVPDQTLFQQFQFRYPEVCRDGKITQSHFEIDRAKGWIQVSRDEGKMPKSPKGSIQQIIIERRVSILFASKKSGSSRPWRILVLADEPVNDPDTTWNTASTLAEKTASDTTCKHMKELLGCQKDKQPLECFFVLLNTLRKELETMSEFWERTLDELENEFKIKIDKVTEGNTLKTWMFDGDNNERSQLYFERLSMLQILSDWVKDVSRDLSNTVKAIPSQYTSAHELTNKEIKGIEVGVNAFREEIRDVSGPITERINQMREEIVIFRDGMFNSTSIREAHEVTRQGHYVLVFTIITIVYLPLAFVTGFFGMNNLENVNGNLLTSWTPFIIVLTVVTVVTYVMAGLSIPWVHWNDISQRSNQLKGLMQRLKPRRREKSDGNPV